MNREFVNMIAINSTLRSLRRANKESALGWIRYTQNSQPESLWEWQKRTSARVSEFTPTVLDIIYLMGDFWITDN